MKLFDLGTVEMRTRAAAALKANNMTADDLLARHQRGDWGDMHEVGRRNNDAGIENALQLYSRYLLPDGTEVHIETGGDRAATIIFLEEEHVFEEVDTRQGYAIWAESYDKGRNPLIEAEEIVLEELIGSLPISSVLDVGTGTGRYALQLARRGARVTAVDQSPEMLALAQQKAKAEGLHIDFHLASLDNDLPLAANQFDFLVCALMLSHIPDLASAARKFHDHLQTDGYLLLTAFHPDIIAHGWRTNFDQAGISYGLPNVLRTRESYLETLVATGFTNLNVFDVPIRDVPAGIFSEAVIEAMGDVNLCLIILAQKG